MYRYALPLALCFGTAVAAEDFNFAVTTDPQTMDPHAVNSAPVLGFLNNVYEGLVRRGKDMSIEPSLAVSWEPIGDGEGWRFNLREGVTFQDGSAFNADDVIFSYERASSEEADTSSWFAPVSEVIKVDDFTVDIIIQLAMESGKIGLGADVMMSTVKSSTLITSLTGANQLEVSA
ncbi:MAG: ABC transporter substrate-binding protein, partial [Pseudomonadota bacterium]